MPAKKKAPEDRAWDADALIGWLGEEPDKQPECKPVIDAVSRGEVRLIVSALAAAEVLKLKHKDHGHVPIPKSSQEKIENFFSWHPHVLVRNVDPATAKLARELVWNNGIDPKDAIHVATALRHKVAVLETFDVGLLNKNPLTIPGYDTLTIRRPWLADEVQESLDLPGLRSGNDA